VADESDENTGESGKETRSPTVLVLDQDDLNLKVIKQVLGDVHEVITTRSVRDAFRIVDSHPIKVIISAHELARMTGLKFFEELEQTGNHATRIIMTTFEHHRHVERALDEHQIFFILIKPVDVIRLKREVEHAVADYDQRGGRPRGRNHRPKED